MSIVSITPDLPWAVLPDEERKFRNIWLVALVLTLCLGFLIPFVHVPKKQRMEEIVVPPRLAKLMMEKRLEEVPPPPRPEKQPPPSQQEAIKKAEMERLKREQERVKEEETRRQAEEKQRQELERQQQEEARRRAEQEAQRIKQERAKGAAVAKELLSGLKEIAQQPPAVARPEVAVTRIDRKVPAGPAGRSEVFSSNVAKGSGGIGGIESKPIYAATSGAGGAVASRETTVIGDEALKIVGGDTAGGKARPRSRPANELALVFEQNKAGIYQLYNRARRQNPTLSGKVVVELNIDAGGAVTGCKIVSSTLGDADLEQKLVLKIKTFNFGAKDVDEVTVVYTYDFVAS